MAHVASKGPIKYDRAREWRRVEGRMLIKPKPKNYSYLADLVLFSDETCVTMSGMFHTHPANKAAAKAFIRALTKDPRIMVDEIETEIDPDQSLDITLFRAEMVPTATFNSKQVTDKLLDLIDLWFQMTI